MLDINGSEFIIIALVAMILVGPERLPEYVRGLRSGVLRLRALLRDGQSALKNEFGEDVDWSQLDPRAYDPRRIVREALFDDDDATPATGTSSAAALATGAIGTATTGSRRQRRGERAQDQAGASRGVPGDDAGRAPVDLEAT